MVQMHMQGGDDDVMLVVLHLGQAAGQVVLVMVIDQGQRACALAVGLLPLLGHKGLADEVTDGFGAVAVALDGRTGRRKVPAALHPEKHQNVSVFPLFASCGRDTVRRCPVVNLAKSS